MSAAQLLDLRDVDVRTSRSLTAPTPPPVWGTVSRHRANQGEALSWMPAPKPHDPPYLFLGRFDCRPGSESSEAGSDLELWALTAPSGPGSPCGSELRGPCAAHLPHLPVLPGVPGPWRPPTLLPP